MFRYIPLFLLLFLAGCCHESSSASVVGRPIRVLATTTMIADAVRNVGGGEVTVDTLMGPGIDPHRFTPSAGDIQRLHQADIILYNGLHLEGKMADVFEEMSKQRKTLAVAGRIPKDKLRLAEEGSDEPDPHVWFDVSLWMHAVEAIRDSLCELDPGRADTFKANAEKYLAELKTLDAEVRSIAEKLPTKQRVLVTSHDAFGYFGRAYGFEVHGLQGVSTASDTGSKDVTNLAALIGVKEVPVIFGESSVPDKGIKAVQEAVRKGFGRTVQLSAKQLYSDALGELDGPAGTYSGMVRFNVNTIVEALQR